MNKVLMILMLALPFVSCGGKSADEQLQGTWQITEKTIEDMTSGEEVPPGAEAMMEDMKAKAKEMTMTFKDDGTFEMKMLVGLGGLQTFKGSYEITKTEGTKVTVEMDKDGEKDTEVFTVDGDSLSFEEAGKPLAFSRK